MVGRGSGDYVKSITIDVGMTIDDVKSKANQLQNDLSKIQIKDTLANDAKKAFEDLFKEIKEYQELEKTVSNDKETKAVEEKWLRIEKAVERVNKISEKATVGKKLDDLVPDNAIKKAEELKKALESIKGDNIDTLKGKLKGLEDSLKEGKTKVEDYQKLLDSLKDKAAANQEINWKGIEGNAQMKGQITKLIGEEKDFEKAQEWINGLIEGNNKLQKEIDETNQKIEETSKVVNRQDPVIQKLRKAIGALTDKGTNDMPWDIDKLINELNQYQEVARQTADINRNQVNKSNEELSEKAKQAADSIKGYMNQIKDMSSYSKQVQQLTNRLMYFFSLTNGFRLLTRAVKQAFTAIKELDKAFTEIAVVSKYSVDEVWSMRSNFVQAANDIGASTNDLIEATTLYVQQGLSLEEAQEIAVETMKMGRIANLNGKDATDLMTAAIRGYRMELTEANHVNDVYSNLAAHSASNTEELATAMSKTASTAYTSGASFENMSAFLAQIIETTREAPETAGTAMKTIISRFQELKEATTDIVDVDGEEVSVNRVEKALKTAGVALRDAKGEFRAFDDVILELASKWDTLDIMTQRYIATQTAGARQQSRFLALMNNYDRLLELTEYATNSAGASTEQFEKTMDSLQASLNQLKNAWELFLTGFANNTIISTVIDLLTGLLNIINKMLAPLNQSDNVIKNLVGSIIQLGLSITAFIYANKLLTKGIEGASKAFLIHIGAQEADNTATKKNTEETVENTGAKNASILASIKEAGKRLLSALGIDTETNALRKQKLTREELVAVQLKNLMLASAYLAIAIAVVAIIVLLVKWWKEYNKTATERQEEINKNIEKTNKNLNETKNKIKEVKTAWEELGQAEKTLDNLAEGTQAWYEQLIKVNDQVLDLIQKYPALAQYLKIDGSKLYIDPKGYEEYLRKQEELAGVQQLSVLAQQSNASRYQTEVEVESVVKDNKAENYLSQYGIDTKILAEAIEKARKDGIDFNVADADTIKGILLKLKVILREIIL